MTPWLKPLLGLRPCRGWRSRCAQRGSCATRPWPRQKLWPMWRQRTLRSCRRPTRLRKVWLPFLFSMHVLVGWCGTGGEVGQGRGVPSLIGRGEAELRTALGRAAQELQVPVEPGASRALQVGNLVSSGREWIRRGVRFGVCTVFAMLGTHYVMVDYEALSLGYHDHTLEEMARIRVDFESHVDVLAAKYEEEALPKVDGEN